MPMPRPDDLSRSLVSLQQDSTLIAVVELSRSSWLVAGIVPGLARHPLKKLEPDQEALLRRWRGEGIKAGEKRARLPRLAARRAGPLQHGRGADARGGGRPAPEPGAGGSGGRAHPDREPDQG